MRIVQNLAATSRTRRQPTHTFQLKHRPFQIQPFMIAPVVPGETMKAALIQVRAVSDAVRNQLVGWWLEHYLFYVKHRDMPQRDLWQSMVLQPGFDVSSAHTAAANLRTGHAGGGIDWVDQCLRAVVPHYFRDDGETYDVAMLDGLPMAKINSKNWADSLANEAMMPDGAAIPATGNTAGSIDLVLQQWQLLREMKLTTATYEEFLASYGVRAQLREEERKPELVRYSRDWTYPSNTVDGATGAVASAASWSVAERADKDRYLSEPGFIFGVTVARPKVYLGYQHGVAANILSDAFAWLPAVLRDDPQTSLRKFEAGTGPLRTSTADYYVDARDLFMHGDQFINIDVDDTVGQANGAAGNAYAVGLPDVYGGIVNTKYITEAAHLDNLFAVAANNTIRQDGRCDLTIAGSIRDHSAPTAVVAPN